MKLDQIAYTSINEMDAFTTKKMLGLHLSDWIKDSMVGDMEVFTQDSLGQVDSHIIPVTADLEFNYDNGVEIEILRFTSGTVNYISHLAKDAGEICHIGHHLEDGEEFSDVVPKGMFLAFRTITTSHTNEFLNQTGRKYEYRIYYPNSEAQTDVAYKYIKRIRGENE